MSGMPRFASRAAMPVGVAAIAAAAVGLGPTLVAAAKPSPPPVTAKQLLVRAQNTHIQTLSGTIGTHTDLGLPELPDNANTDMRGPLKALTSDHTVRVALDGPKRQRVQVLDKLAERDLIHNGRDVWAYDSKANKVTHWRLPAGSGGSHADRDQAPSAPTPQRLAQRFLDKAGKTTKVSVDGTATVAGRDAYVLDLAPKAQESTIGSVKVYVDADNSVPLRVSVTPRTGGPPAVDVGFSDVSFSTPPASRFDFTPPKGATVKQGRLPAGDMPTRMFHHSAHRSTANGNGSHGSERATPGAAHQMAGMSHKVIGHGWTAVLESKVGPGVASMPIVRSGQRVDGGRLVTTRLVNALVTDDGHVYVGAVTPRALLDAAGHS
ncbi:MAG: LolA family protein [Streptosporangiaceae bacterium]